MDAQQAPNAKPAGLAARLRRALGGSHEASLTRRLAGGVVLIRIASAALAYAAQVLLARWMTGSDYGIYVYVWIWVLLLGSLLDFGISASAQKIIPEYLARDETALLRGFLSGTAADVRHLGARRAGDDAWCGGCRPGSATTPRRR